MRAVLLGLCSAALALTLTACVSFSNGIADKPAAYDRRLIGNWEVADNKAPGGFISITADGPTSLIITMYSDDQSCEKADRLMAVRTRIGQRDFLDMSSANRDPAERRHAPLAYEFQAADRLAAFSVDEDAFASAIKAKELPGTVSTYRETNLPTVIEVTASVEELRQWLSAHPEAMQHKGLILTRLDPAKPLRCV